MSGRGAKGSIKDRLLSILYRIRYKKYLKKKERYYKKNKIRLRFIYKSFFRNKRIKIIKIIPRKNIKGKKVYKRKVKHVGIGPNENIVISVKKINSSLLIQVKSNKKVIYKPVYKKVNNKNYVYISNITPKFKMVRRKFKKGIYIPDKGKNVVKTIDKAIYPVVVLPKLKNNKINAQKIMITNSIENKKAKIVRKKFKKGIGYKTPLKIVKENKYNVLKNLNLKKAKVKSIEIIDEKIKKEIEEQKRILKSMKSKVSKIDITTSKTIKLSGFGRIISSILKIATGLLTLPFSGTNMFGIMLGATLVNKGIRGLRKGLNRQEVTNINYNYEDLKYKILRSKNKLSDTKLLIIDSLEQVQLLKEEFIDKFKDYKVIDPLYDEIFKDIENIEDKLKNKKKEIEEIDKKFNKQYELNKVKLKKINKNNY